MKKFPPIGIVVSKKDYESIGEKLMDRLKRVMPKETTATLLPAIARKESRAITNMILISREDFQKLIKHRKDWDTKEEVKIYTLFHETLHYVCALSRKSSIIYASLIERYIDDGCTNYFAQIFMRKSPLNLDFGIIWGLVSIDEKTIAEVAEELVC